MLTKNNRLTCDYCGRFISIQQLFYQEAIHYMATPDSHFSKEEWESYHKACLRRSNEKVPPEVP